jgi:hypothetical protein
MPVDFLGTLTDHELQTLCVPLDQCVSVTAGKIDPSILGELEARGFDQAPVYDSTGGLLLGLISTERLRTIHAADSELSETDAEVRSEGHFLYTGPLLTVEHLLSSLSARRAVFVVRESSATGAGASWTNYGLLTISDLNRHALRGAFYALLSETESGLASIIETHFAEPWQWIQRLGESHQVSVLGYWELSKRRGVDIGPIAATTLVQLLNVVARSKELLKKLGFKSRKEFEDELGRVPELRNCVMHPVRPLVLSMTEVAKLRETVSAVMHLYKAVEEVRTARKAG